MMSDQAIHDCWRLLLAMNLAASAVNLFCPAKDRESKLAILRGIQSAHTSPAVNDAVDVVHRRIIRSTIRKAS
ncbi:MAG: hypothetical protein ACR2QF_00460 [Geminicoccaceae bacterium]